MRVWTNVFRIIKAAARRRTVSSRPLASCRFAHRAPLIAAAVVVLVAFTIQVQAEDRYWQSASGDWADPANWDPAEVPTSADKACIDNDGTATIASTAAAFYAYIGDENTGTVIQTGGTHSVRDSLRLALQPGSTGVYQLEGGSLDVTEGGGYGSPRATIGSRGNGRFNQIGGAHTTRRLVVGWGEGSAGVYDLQEGQLTTGGVTVGREGTGSFSQTGGTHSVHYLCLGEVPGSTGLYNLQGGELMVDDDEIVGDWGGTGTFTQTGGAHGVAGTLYLGMGIFGGTIPSTGVYDLQGGTLSVNTIAAGEGIWAFNFTGGTLHAGTVEFDLLNDGGVLAPGQSIGTTAITGSYTQNAGILEIELGQDAADSLAVTGLATLGGTLELVSLGSRPREGQTFAVVTADGGFVDDFSEVLSDIVNGIPEGLEAFSTTINGTAYEVVFNGYTAGDANGDHKASIGDLCILAGNWNQAVTGGYGDADFNGDGIVSIGDLSMLAGNWGWELPGSSAIPEPVTLWLLAAGVLAIGRRRRGRGSLRQE